MKRQLRQLPLAEALEPRKLMASTTSEVTLVKQFMSGAGSNPRMMTNVDGTLYFVADDAQASIDLWKSDGTSAGTTKIKDGVGQDFDLSDDFDVDSETAVSGKLFFFGMENQGSSAKLWRSDGTANGTFALTTNGQMAETPVSLRTVGSKVMFLADNGAVEGGYDLWKSDGTVAGTTKIIANVVTGLAAIDGDGVRLAQGGVIGSTYVFTGMDLNGNSEPWRSDGTAAGTYLLKNIRTGTSAPSYPRAFTNVNGKLMFIAADDNGSTSHIDIWKTDGTPAGTVKVADGISSYSTGYFFRSTASSGSRFYFVSTDDNQQLYRSDGTGAGTVKITGVNPGGTGNISLGNLADVNGTLFFIAQRDSGALELWKAGVSSTSASLVSKIPGLTAYSFINGQVAVGNSYFFSEVTDSETDFSSTSSLFRSDGTSSGTHAVDGLADTEPFHLAAFNNRLVFDGNLGSVNDALLTAPPALPSISVTASDSKAKEGASDPGTFTFTRTGGTSAALNVNYTISGSATNGTDYPTLSGTVTIPAGSASTVLKVTAKTDAIYDPGETLTLTLKTATTYLAGSSTTATVTIADQLATGPSLGKITAGGAVMAPLVLAGSFSATAATSLRYTYSSGKTLDVPLFGGVSATQIKTALPPLFDLTTGTVFSGSVKVSAVQSGTASVPQSLTVKPLPTLPSSLPTGAVLISYLNGQVTAIDKVTKDFAGTKALTATQASSYKLARAELASRITVLKAVQNGSSKGYVVKLNNGTVVTLSAENLKMMDQILTATMQADIPMFTPSKIQQAFCEAALNPTYNGATLQNAANNYEQQYWYTDTTHVADSYNFDADRLGTAANYASALNKKVPGQVGNAVAATEVINDIYAGSTLSYGASLDIDPVAREAARDRANSYFTDAGLTTAVTVALAPLESGSMVSLALASKKVEDGSLAVPFATVSVEPDTDGSTDTIESTGNSRSFIISTGGGVGSPSRVVYYSLNGPDGSPRLAAENGVDYELINAHSAIVPASSSFVRVRITPKTDSVKEGAEPVTITLLPAPDDSYLLAGNMSGIDNDQDPTATIKIYDRPDISLTASATQLSPNDSATITLSRTGPAIGTVTAYITLQAGTAKDRTDFDTPGFDSVDLTNVTYVFKPGELTHTLTVKALAAGAGKTITISVNESPNRYAVAKKSVSIAIVAKPTVSVTADGGAITERDNSVVTITFSRTGSTAAALVVKYGFDSIGNAINGIDFANANTGDKLSGSITIPAGKTSASIDVYALTDLVVNESEFFYLKISTSSLYSISSKSYVTVLVNDQNYLKDYFGGYTLDYARTSGGDIGTLSTAGTMDIRVTDAHDGRPDQAVITLFNSHSLMLTGQGSARPVETEETQTVQLYNYTNNVFEGDITLAFILGNYTHYVRLTINVSLSYNGLSVTFSDGDSNDKVSGSGSAN